MSDEAILFVGAPLAVAAIFPAETFAGGSALGDYKVLLGAAVWLAFALVCRTRVASIPTDLGLIAAIVTFAWTTVDRVGQLVAPSLYYVPAPAEGAIWWMLIMLSGTVLATLAIGLLALWELRSVGSDPGAGRRLAIARGSAGATLAIGTAFATLTGMAGYDRPVEPVVGDVVVLVAAAALTALALTRRAAAYIYPAGLAVLIAFTDLNGEYLASGVGVGPALLVEGLGLIAVGFVTQSGRRWVSRQDPIDGSSHGETELGRVAASAPNQPARPASASADNGPVKALSSD